MRGGKGWFVSCDCYINYGTRTIPLESDPGLRAIISR